MSDLQQRTVTIERTFNAPLPLVWEAWTKPEHIAQWWSPGQGPMRIVTHEFTVGGKWQFAMGMPNGQEFISEGTYLEIVPQQRIVTTADFKPMTEDVELHVTFEAKGDQTLFTFKVVHKTVAYREQQEQMGIYNGWGGAFDRLSEFLLKLLAAS